MSAEMYASRFKPSWRPCALFSALIIWESDFEAASLSWRVVKTPPPPLGKAAKILRVALPLFGGGFDAISAAGQLTICRLAETLRDCRRPVRRKIRQQSAASVNLIASVKPGVFLLFITYYSCLSFLATRSMKDALCQLIDSRILGRTLFQCGRFPIPVGRGLI